jgi:adenylate cyclase
VARDHRRLAAIVSLDVAGYSRLMEVDDSGTLAALKAHRRELIDPKIADHDGRIVKTTGDGLLLEFPSVVDAVRCAVEVQRGMAERNAGVASDKRLDFRIGINVGDIIIDDDDIFGDGVNVAARLESIAEPGHIRISSSVYEQVRPILDLPYEEMGEQKVKNIAKPVRSYAIRCGSFERAFETARAPDAVGSGSRGASIAVLPFSNLSGDADQEYFADGMVDDIITALSRFKWLVVIARTSTFTYRGRAVDVRQIAKELGVRYVLEGSVRKADRHVRITGQLIDATTGVHLWADRFDGYLEDIFDLQDRLTESVVGVVEPQIRKAEIERARRKRPESLDGYDLFLRALPHAYAMRLDDNSKALQLLEEAMRLDPGFVPARAFAAWCYEQRLTRGWPTAREGDAAIGLMLARSVLSAETDDANAIAIAGFVVVMVGRDFDVGLAALRRAVDLNPNNTFILMNSGWANAFAGDLGEASALLSRARTLNPNDPAAFFVITGLGMVSLLSGRYGEAAELAARSAALYGEWDATYCVLCVALAHAGRIDEARAAAAKLVALLPGATISGWASKLPLSDPERVAIVKEGLRIAGLPE